MAAHATAWRMVRMTLTKSHLHARALPLVLLALLVLSVVPARLLRWTSAFGELAHTIFLPISDPVSRASHYLRPAGRAAGGGGGGMNEAMDDVLAERDLALLMLEQLRDENARLRKLNADLQGGLDLNPALPVRAISAPVIGRSSDVTSPLLTVRAGANAGVAEISTVAVADGVQLVGRVVRVGRLSSQVRPITDKGGGGLDGLVMVSGDVRLMCRLSPGPDGTLRGPVEFIEPQPGQPSITIEPGMLVRLRDETWPENAQMLEIGRVVEVEPNPAQPLRRMITVAPRVALDRVSQVVLRIPVDPEAERDEEGGG